VISIFWYRRSDWLFPLPAAGSDWQQVFSTEKTNHHHPGTLYLIYDFWITHIIPVTHHIL
jgi:hypothetical protein